MNALVELRSAVPGGCLEYEWRGDDPSQWKRVKLDDQGEIVEL
jgi:hypothetical protein